ncbi:MAG: hypothetical protein LC722_08880 [Actinobacteria bacterium]|nr:hypothetical protein [Actinomycetota bacterium]
MRRSRVVPLALATAVLLAACSSDQPDGSVNGAPPPGGAAPSTSQPGISVGAAPRVAFSSDREGNTEIYVVGLDGSGEVRLTSEPGEDQHPAWSPDGTRIAFTSDRGGARAIHVMNADGSDPHPLIADPPEGADQDWPVWTPDGRRIAFVEGGGIFSVAADGSDRRTIRDDDSFYRELQWSPREPRLLYASNHDQGDYELFLFDPAAGTEDRLTTPDGFDGNAVFSPDGGTIVWNTNESGLQPIGAMEADGTNQRGLLAGAPGVVGSPSFTSDGSQIVYVSSEGGDPELWIMGADGSNPQQLTHGADASEYDAEVSPAA